MATANILLGLFSALLAGMLQLWMRSIRGLFVTMTYLVLEAQGGELCYATGGHPPSCAATELPVLWKILMRKWAGFLPCPRKMI